MKSGRGVAGGPHGETFWKNEGYTLDVGVSGELGYSSFQPWKREIITLLAVGHVGKPGWERGTAVEG